MSSIELTSQFALGTSTISVRSLLGLPPTNTDAPDMRDGSSCEEDRLLRDCIVLTSSYGTEDLHIQRRGDWKGR